jgi:hypothetical protein
VLRRVDRHAQTVAQALEHARSTMVQMDAWSTCIALPAALLIVSMGITPTAATYWDYVNWLFVIVASCLLLAGLVGLVLHVPMHEVHRDRTLAVVWLSSRTIFYALGWIIYLLLRDSLQYRTLDAAFVVAGRRLGE